VGRDDDREDTPPTGVAVPRPRLKAVDVPRGVTTTAVEDQRAPSSAPPPASRPINPTLDDIYRLIDARLSPQIVERISSIPPPKPVASMPVRALKHGGRWTKWAAAVIGVLAVIGEIWADVEKIRGPLSQLLVIGARYMDASEAEQGAPPALQAPSPEPE
jgi:hypothetical protein